MENDLSRMSGASRPVLMLMFVLVFVFMTVLVFMIAMYMLLMLVLMVSFVLRMRGSARATGQQVSAYHARPIYFSHNL